MNKKDSKVRGQGPSIVVKNADKKHGINERFIKRLVQEILRILRKPRDKKLEVVFLSDEAIRPLNRRYRQTDRATDVLSFDLGPFGSIIISPDAALKNSGIYGTPFEQELALYVIHGILHLYGYKDETVIQKRRMSQKEIDILKKLCERLDLSKVLTRR